MYTQKLNFQFFSSNAIPYPHGKNRSKLGQLGLIGKIRLTSAMTVQEVEEEVRSVFKKPMGERSEFPFSFLQPTGGKSKVLTIPSLSTSFSWTAQQVAKLGTAKQAVYIIAGDDLIFSKV